MAPLSLLCFAPLFAHPNCRDGRCANFNNQHKPSNLARTIGTTALAAATGADILPTVREGVVELTGSDESWKASAAALCGLKGIEDVEDAEVLLADALNWKGWAMSTGMMRKFMKPKTPDVEKLANALAWLRDGPLALDEDQLAVAVRDSPKVYLDDPEETYKLAISVAPEQYSDPDVFRGLILKDPSVLQCTYNCSEEGCGSECGNCWVSYEGRL